MNGITHLFVACHGLRHSLYRLCDVWVEGDESHDELMTSSMTASKTLQLEFWAVFATVVIPWNIGTSAANLLYEKIQGVGVI